MANPQINELVDYIKKAKQANQSDQQTRQILLKNGWSNAEVEEAFVVIIPVEKPQQPAQQPQQQIQHPQQTQPQAQPQYQARPTQSSMPKTRRSNLTLNLFIVLIILVILGGVEYLFVLKNDLLYSTNTLSSLPAENKAKKEQPAQLNLATVKITAISQDYDISKAVVSTLFSKAADKAAYCAPKKAESKIDCFLNDAKLGNSYSYKPYWIGISPDGNRVVFLYFDAVKKQSFVFENGKEGARYEGAITSPSFGNDSQSFMYIVMGRDNKNFVVLNGSASAPHEKIYGVPSLSGDGRYLLYGARDGQDIFWVADEVK